MSDRAPDGESARLGALYQLQLLDTAPDPACDGLVEVVARCFGAPYAALALVDIDRVWLKAATLLGGGREMVREASPASLAVRRPGEAIVLQVDEGSPLGDHPAQSAAGGVATMAAVAVAGPDGLPVGAIELGWRTSVVLSAEDEALLRSLADHAATVVSLVTEIGEYGRFVDLSPDAVAILDANGVVQRANPALARLVGRSLAEDLIGRPLTGLLVPPDRSLATSQVARVLFGAGRTGTFDAGLLHADGRTIPCEVKVGHLGGAREHVQVVVHDLSTRLRREEERTKLSEQLARAQRFDTVGQLASALAHDLNNLLVVMLSNLGLAGESLDDLADEVGEDRLATVRTDLQEIAHAVDRATRLTGGLLDFARRETGQQTTADVGEVVEAVEQLLSRSLRADATLEVMVADGLPRAAVDPTQLERALVNLLMNARDALDEEGGTIRLFASPAALTDPADAAVGSRPRPGVRIEVIDDGCGMPDEVRIRAFEPLYSTKTEQGGSGLGLASVLAFVEEAEGTIRLASRPGVGTSISLTLPAHGEAPVELPVGVDVPVAGARVVVVDPGERTRRTIAAMLRSAGYRVASAGSGEDALELLTEQPADLVLTELSLPGMTGRRLLERLDETGLPVAAVYLSTVEAREDLDGVPVLVKPFSSMRLLRVVEGVLAGR